MSAEGTAHTGGRGRASRRARVCLPALLLFVWAAATAARAADNTLYALTNNSPYTIYTINTASGAATSAGTLSFSSASLARSPTSGLLYYTEINATGGVYRVATWNPATSANTILSGTVNVYLPRLAFRSDGTLFGMDSNNNLYTLNTATGAILTTSGPVTGGGLTAGLGGDMAFAPDGTLYMVAGTTLYRVSGTTATLVGNTGASASFAGLAFATDGSLYASDTSTGSTLIYKLSTANGAGTLVGSSVAGLSDLASMPKFADLSITKAASGSFVTGRNASYTLTVGNAGPQSASGPVTVSDTLPAGLSYVSAAGTGWACSASGAAVTCTTAGPVSSGATLPAITLTVAVASAAVPSVANTATVSGTTFDAVPANNSSTATTTVTNPPSVTLNKSVSPTGAQAPGADLTYTITFTNAGGMSASGLAITDPVPASTDFKVGSVTNTLGTTGLAVSVAYSNDGGSTYAYTPASGGGGAPSGYDRNVTHVRWTFTGNLSQSSPNNAGDVRFTTRIR